MTSAIQVQILYEVDFISYSTNTLGKGMNPIILPPAIGYYLDRLGSLVLGRQPVLEKENSELKLVKHRLKIDLVSVGLVNGYVYKYIYFWREYI